MTAGTATLDIDLEEVKQAVGDRSFQRGRTYANKLRVLSPTLEDDGACLHGRVVGNGAIYHTSAYFSADESGTHFDEGECTCPVNYNCKHVAALVISVTDTRRNRRPNTGLSLPRVPSQPPASNLRPDPPRPPAAPEWQRSLRAIIGERASGSSTGTALALELAVAFTSMSSGGAPRLKARLMRPGARGGWVNGSLSFGSLESWRFAGDGYREDHLALARELANAHRASLSSGSRYLYGYGDERSIDLSDWDAGQLWGLLDRAARIGMHMIHAGKLGELPRHHRAELTLDITTGDDGSLQLSPALQFEPAEELAAFEPLMFLGRSGHGLLLVQRDVPGQVPHRQITERPLRLVRLARETPFELQRLVLDGCDLTIPRDELAAFTAAAPALSRVTQVVSSDESFTLPEVSAPELVLRASYDRGHRTTLEWGFSYRIEERELSFTLAPDDDADGLRDPLAEQELIGGTVLSDTGLASLGILDSSGRPALGARVLDGFDTVRFATEAVPALTQLEADVRLELSGEPLPYRDADEQLQIAVATTAASGQQDWFDLDITITVEGHELPFALVFSALARGQERMLLDDGAHFSLRAPELDSLAQLIAEARLLGEGSRPGALRISRYQASLWQELVGLGVVREQAEA